MHEHVVIPLLFVFITQVTYKLLMVRILRYIFEVDINPISIVLTQQSQEEKKLAPLNE